VPAREVRRKPRCFEAALGLYDPVRDRTSAFVYAIDSRVMCLTWLSHVYLILGHPEQALACDGEVPVYVGRHRDVAAAKLFEFLCTLSLI
jgi:hypothetical protein